jgi:hypothetical protein
MSVSNVIFEPMSWIPRLGIFLFMIIYCQAVFEVNTDYFTNTWGDEYDQYIQSGNSFDCSVRPVQMFQVDFPIILFNPQIELLKGCLSASRLLSHTKHSSITHYKKRFLDLETLLI